MTLNTNIMFPTVLSLCISCIKYGLEWTVFGSNNAENLNKPIFVVVIFILSRL